MQPETPNRLSSTAAGGLLPIRGGRVFSELSIPAPESVSQT